MEQFFKRYFWSLQIAVIAIIALLVAGGINGFLGAYLARWTVAVPGGSAVAPADSDGDEQGEALSELSIPNVFPQAEPTAPPDPCADERCAEGEVCNPETGRCELPPEAVAEQGTGPCVESDIAINLVGTMVATDPVWSLAVLHNPSTNRTEFAGVGTTLLQQAEVIRVERNRIFLRRNGREECLRPGDQSARAQRSGPRPGSNPTRAEPRDPSRPSITTASPSSPTVPSPAPGGGSMEERLRSSVTAVGDGEYEIQRSAIEEVAGNAELLQSQAPRVVPNYRDGRPNGFRLQNVRSDSLFSAIGIRNGDVIQSVNGTTIDSPQRALELYQGLMTQNRVEIVVERRGRQQTLVYNIR